MSALANAFEDEVSSEESVEEQPQNLFENADATNADDENANDENANDENANVDEKTNEMNDPNANDSNPNELVLPPLWSQEEIDHFIESRSNWKGT